MKLKNKYAFGCLMQWYEIEMVEEHINSLIQMMEGIENPQNVTFDFCIGLDERLEECEPENFTDKDGYEYLFIDHLYDSICKKIDKLKSLFPIDINGNSPQIKINETSQFYPDFYNIAAYRRDFNFRYAQKVDLLCWSETDSLWPKQTLELLEGLHESVKESTPKYIANFADRRLWDNSFAPLHPIYERVAFRDDEEWQFNNPSSGKAYMSLEHMNLINNILIEDVQVESYKNPRFDGSCVCFSSDLIKAGVNIPHALIHCSEDVSLGVIAKKLLGDQFVQYCFRNILHVHNRRHPKKRSFIKGENNPIGKCTVADKGEWWKILEDSSKANFNNLFTQQPFIKMDEVMEKIKLSKDLEK